MALSSRILLFLYIFATSIVVSFAYEADDATVGKFIIFSDVHYDPFYGTSQALDWGSNGCSNADAPPFSTYGCEASKDLVRSALVNAARVSPNPDFILFTGDATRHGTELLGSNGAQQTVYEAFTLIHDLLQENFANTPYVSLPPLDLGNNDFESDYRLDITSLEPCFVGSDGSLPMATNSWLSNIEQTFRSQFVSNEEAAIFACGGYLSREVSDGLNIIVLNSLLWSDKIATNTYNTSLEGENFDPFGQHAWLLQELTNLRNLGKKAYITGHIPPISMSYYPYEGGALMYESHLLRYYDTASQFADVISGQMFGHIHSNELRVAHNLPGDSPPMIIVGAISPIYTSNPLFSVVSYDRESKFPLDLATYSVDLNEEVTLLGSNIVEFRPLFSSLLDQLGLSNLTNTEVMNLAGRLVTDERGIEWIRYWQQWYKGTEQPKCNGQCRIKEACIVACGSLKLMWQDCVSDIGSSDDKACSLPQSAYDAVKKSQQIVRICVMLGFGLLLLIVMALSITWCRGRRRRFQRAPVDDVRWEIQEIEEKSIETLPSLT